MNCSIFSGSRPLPIGVLISLGAGGDGTPPLMLTWLTIGLEASGSTTTAARMRMKPPETTGCGNVQIAWLGEEVSQWTGGVPGSPSTPSGASVTCGGSETDTVADPSLLEPPTFSTTMK